MKPELIELAIRRALKSSKWMLRRSYDGRSHGGFEWAPLGQWTVAPDWNPKPECGGGLHGNDRHTTDCYWSDGSRIDFCEYSGDPVRIGGEGGKIKVGRARILMHGIPAGIKEFNGSLDLRGTTFPAGTTFPQTVRGSLDLEDATLPAGTKLPQTVGGWLDLGGTTIPAGTKLPQTVGDWLDLEDATLPAGTKLPQTVRGWLYLSGATLPAGTKLPQTVGRIYR